ncbi:hypothetical protein HOLleu_39333 [Holothuria leucospilota]|uniref:CCHC-type domain-containing protein n=1 Tax=Holothuria leucospilota TaxID=206669 RepID=A0A9Q1BES9_HOLLE|nr:hypothetical protein HOLleu_39333 [Holothuria leucospilota]
MSAIILDGLDITTSQEEVNEVIETVGKVVSIEFARNPFTGILLGSAKCVYDGDVSHLALEAFREGCVIKGKTVQVSLAPPSVENQETPGASTSSLEETQPPPLTMNPDRSDFIDKLKEEGYEIKPPLNLNVTKPMKTRGDKQTASKFPASFATLNQPHVCHFSWVIRNQSLGKHFETWKYEVECLQKEGGFAKEILTPLVKRSLRGEAGEIARHLGVDASIKEIIEKLEILYGTVESGSTLFRQVYTSRQEAEETAAQYGRRLQVKINRARERGGISSLAIDETLKSVFWQGMRDANVKNALRHRKDTVGSFDELLRLVRLAEQEAAEDASRFHARTTGKRVTGSAFMQSTDGPREASRPTERGRLGETPQSDVKEMQETIKRLTARLEKLEKVKSVKKEGPTNNKSDERPKRKPIVCYKCGKEGHIAAGCRNPPTQAWLERQQQQNEEQLN